MYRLISIYKDDPTEGERDGTEVSTAGDFTSPISIELDAEQNETTIVKLAVRTALGYATHGGGVTVITVRDDPDEHFSLSKDVDGEFSKTISFDLPITANNTIFYLKAVSRDSEYPTVDRAACLAINTPIVPIVSG